MKSFFYIITIIASLTTSCAKKTDSKKAIDSIWVPRSYESSITVYSRENQFQENESGFNIFKNGTLKVKQNSGSCGTPPIDWEIVSGEWQIKNDTLLTLKRPIWSNKNYTQNYIIVKITEDSLFLKESY